MRARQLHRWFCVLNITCPLFASYRESFGARPCLSTVGVSEISADAPDTLCSLRIAVSAGGEPGG